MDKRQRVKSWEDLFGHYPRRPIPASPNGSVAHTREWKRHRRGVRKFHLKLVLESKAYRAFETNGDVCGSRSDMLDALRYSIQVGWPNPLASQADR